MRDGYKKRGQFTIFVIVGIVIFFIFSFAIYSRAKLVSTQLTTLADRQIKEYIDRNSINQYVTSCLDAVANEAIIQAGIQGGVYNFSGQTLNTDYVLYTDSYHNRTVNLSIVIKENNGCPDSRPAYQYVVTQSPGFYPFTFGNVYLNALDSLYKPAYAGGINNCTINNFHEHSGFFGVNNLSILCDLNGANTVDFRYGNSNSISCDYYNYENTLQVSMQDFISREVNKCINFTEVLKRSPSNITLVGNVSSRVLFGQQGMEITLEYPFTIMMFNRQPVTRMFDFTVNKNIAFKELYDYTYELANNEVKDIKFYINRSGNSITSRSTRRLGEDVFSSNYIIDIHSGNAYNNFTDIISVIDYDNKINGEPLVINFGIKNRRPALEYIHEGTSDLYDVLGVENETMILTPVGFDPDREADNEHLTYIYNLWAEDYKNVYNYTDIKCREPDNLNYIIANCTNGFNISLSGAPHNWSNSTLYISTQTNASYRPSKEDTGYHIVRITIYDRNNLYDYQDVRIMVFDLPTAKINATNLYDDIPSNYTSYEDAYILNGTNSIAGTIAQSIGATLSTFTWNDSQEPFNITVDVRPGIQYRTLFIPNISLLTFSPDVAIWNITQYTFAKKGVSSQIHNISLTVNTSMGLKHTATWQVNVTQCVPHKATPFVYPYPYNPQPYNLINSLMANHTCCLSNYSYAPNTVECFNNVRYGLNRTLTDYRFYPNIPQDPNANPSYNIVYSGIILGDKTDNDIFRQTFLRNCSADRGNTCTGQASEEREDVTKCDDKNNGVSNIWVFGTYERCSGPPIANINVNLSSNPGCINYGSGQTFEKLSGAGTGSCTGASGRCATGNGPAESFGFGVSVYKYKCAGGCNSVNGKCEPTNCLCDRTCDGGVSSECEIYGPGSHNTGKCDINSIEKECNNCNYQTTGKCKLTGLNNCNANIDCDGKTPGMATGNCNAGINPGIPDKCSNSCGVEDFGTTCSSSCPGVATECDTKSPLSISSNPNKYCNENCQLEDCGAHIPDMSEPSHCKTQCTFNSDCSTNSCCTTPGKLRFRDCLEIGETCNSAPS
jgi:hypothetical protein